MKRKKRKIKRVILSNVYQVRRRWKIYNISQPVRNRRIHIAYIFFVCFASRKSENVLPGMSFVRLSITAFPDIFRYSVECLPASEKECLEIENLITNDTIGYWISSIIGKYKYNCLPMKYFRIGFLMTLRCIDCVNDLPCPVTFLSRTVRAIFIPVSDRIENKKPETHST